MADFVQITPTCTLLIIKLHSIFVKGLKHVSLSWINTLFEFRYNPDYNCSVCHGYTVPLPNDVNMVVPCDGYIFCITGPCCGEPIYHRRISSRKASDVEP